MHATRHLLISSASEKFIAVSVSALPAASRPYTGWKKNERTPVGKGSSTTYEGFSSLQGSVALKKETREVAFTWTTQVK